MKRRLFARRGSIWRPGTVIGAGAAILLAAAVGIAMTMDGATDNRLPPAAAVPVPVAKIAKPKPLPPPVPQTEYDREAAMDPNALMLRWAPQVAEASKRLDVPQ